MSVFHKVTILVLVLPLLIWPNLNLAAGEASKGKSTTQKKSSIGEICITFDELPVALSFNEIDRTAFTEQLLSSLSKHDVRATGFVVGESIDESYDLLGQWLNAGHTLGNLTYSHHDLNEIGLESFIRDMVAGAEAVEPMLSGFGQKKRYFRYPFLHYGATMQAKRQVKLYNDDNNIVTVPATIVVEDYLYNLSLEKLGDNIDSVEYDNLLNEYINHVLDELERVDALSKKLLKRRCRHILQLRANKLNALFLDELLSAIEAEGYRFISLQRALADKLYSMDEAYFGPRGAGYLDMIDRSDPDLLPAQ